MDLHGFTFYNCFIIQFIISIVSLSVLFIALPDQDPVSRPDSRNLHCVLRYESIRNVSCFLTSHVTCCCNGRVQLMIGVVWFVSWFSPKVMISNFWIESSRDRDSFYDRACLLAMYAYCILILSLNLDPKMSGPKKMMTSSSVRYWHQHVPNADLFSSQNKE